MAILQIPVAKAGKNVIVEVDTDAITDEATYLNIFKEGLKACLNARMSKVGPVTKLEKEGKLEELAKENAAALSIAQKNLTDLLAGEFKFSGTKAKSSESKDVMTEAMRLARDVIRDQLRAHKITISHVAPKDITAAAKALVESDPTYIAKAKESLAQRHAVPTDTIDLAALGIKADPVKVAAAEKAKAERNERAKTLSKTQAGKPKSRTKPKADAATVMAAAVAAGGGNHPHPVH